MLCVPTFESALGGSEGVEFLGIGAHLSSVCISRYTFSDIACHSLALRKNGEGGIRTRSLRYILENKDLGHKPFFCNELCATIRYYSRTIFTRFVTPKIGQ